MTAIKTVPLGRHEQRDNAADDVIGGAIARDSEGRPVLIGSRCDVCGVTTFPKRSVCPSCMSEKVVEEVMPRTGTLYSFTVLRVGPERWLRPAALGYVDLPNDVRVFSRIVGDLDAIRISQPVELDVAVVGREADGSPLSSFVFKPLEQSR